MNGERASDLPWNNFTAEESATPRLELPRMSMGAEETGQTKKAASGASAETQATTTTTTNSATGKESSSQIKPASGEATQASNGSVSATIEDGQAQQEKKVSGKALKERAKAEKAAKRAREKQVRQQGQPVVDLGIPNANNGQTSDTGRPTDSQSTRAMNNAASAKQGHRPTQRRKSSVGAQGKVLPIRAQDKGKGQDKAKSKHDAAAKDLKIEDKRVDIVQHLYGPYRRTSTIGAARDVHPTILALGLQLSAYKICGSNARCIATLLALKEVIRVYTTPPGTSLPRHLTIHLASQIDYLVSCRPLSISQGNAIRWLKVIISQVDVQLNEEKAKAGLAEAIDNLIRDRIEIADEIITTSVCEMIQDGDVILTHAKSSLVEMILARAFVQEKKKFGVIVVESEPLCEGESLANSLSELGIPVQYTTPFTLTHASPAPTKTILGAHAMMSNGALYSRTGTAMVALESRTRKIPVIVCCESIKFTDRVALDSFVHNEIAPPEEFIPPVPLLSADGNRKDEKPTRLIHWRDLPGLKVLNLMYDVTPAEMIDVVVSEHGRISPDSVSAVFASSSNS